MTAVFRTIVIINIVIEYITAPITDWFVPLHQNIIILF